MSILDNPNIAMFSPIETLLHTIINQYFINSYCFTLVSEVQFDFNFHGSFTYVIPNNTDEHFVYQLLNVSEKGCSDYIVRMYKPQRFITAFEEVNQIGNLRRSNKKVIFLLLQEESNTTKPEDLFFMKESRFLANILVILQKNNGLDCESFDFITHKFVGRDNQIDQPLLLDQWDSCTGNFIRDSNLFPHDLTDLQGKTVKVACFTYKPYVILDIDKHYEPLGRDGMEIRVVDEFCRWINCTVRLVVEDENQWGEIYANKTGIGVIGSVYEDRADMGITALYSWFEEFVVMDFSAPCVRTAITCVAPSPRVLASWEMPLMPFTWYMWFAVLITFVIAAVGLIIATCSTEGIFLSVFGIMVSQSLQIADTWRIRSVSGWLLMAGLILGSAYGGGLASTFTVPKYEASIDTIQDIVDRNLHWGATHDAWIFSLTLSPEPLIKKLVSQFRTYPEEILKKKSFTRKMAFSIEKLPAGYFAIGEYITKEAMLDLRLMVEDFYYEQCVVMLRKSSVYTEKMSKFVGRLHQSGLILAWETQVALKHLNNKVQLEVKLSRFKSDVGETKALSFRHVVGIFILYVMGVILSIIIFVGEILTAKIVSSKIY